MGQGNSHKGGRKAQRAELHANWPVTGRVSDPCPKASQMRDKVIVRHGDFLAAALGPGGSSNTHATPVSARHRHS